MLQAKYEHQRESLGTDLAGLVLDLVASEVWQITTPMFGYGELQVAMEHNTEQKQS